MNENIKKMAEFLKNGNTMLDITCPQCSSPLFKLKNNDIFCVNCQKRVVILKNELDVVSFNKSTILSEIDELLHQKIAAVSALLKNEPDLDQQASLLKLLYSYLSSLEKLKNLQKP